MLYWILIAFLLLILFYLVFISFNFQIFYHRIFFKNSVVKKLKKKFNAKFHKKAYFTKNHKIVSENQKNNFFDRHKINFNHCYNCITFETGNSTWEVFFHLIKDGNFYSEIMSIRMFPNGIKLKSQGSVEKTFSGLNVLTNNRYLTDLLEEKESKDILNKFIVKNDDILLISYNMLYFKTFVDSSQISYKDIVYIIKKMNEIKNKVFRKGAIEY